MHRIRCFLLLTICLAFPVFGAAPDIPEPLKPWVGWVLEEHRDYRCPFLYNDFDYKNCIWPARLKLDLEAEKGSFAMDVAVYAESWVRLPGDNKHWPQQVTINGKPAPVQDRDNVPSLLLTAGNYRIGGQFFWDELPVALALPYNSGLIDLTVSGQNIPMPNFKDGQLWIKPGENGAGAQPAAENSLDVQVFRRIIDDVPLQVVTRIELDVSGVQREMKLSSPLLPGFIPLQLQSELAARLDADGQLLLQLRPGHWQVDVTARHPQELLQLPLQKNPAPWPDAETWSFDARPYQRVVEIHNLPAIDPQQSNLPEEWRNLPAYRINAGETLQFTLIRRGDSDPEPNQLNLERTFWLDFDGGGYTVNDRIDGTMTQSRRLNALPEVQLGQVMLDGGGQLITHLPGSNERGVEVRKGTVHLSADSRIEPRSGSLSAGGWQQSFQNVRAKLNLPPGWRLLGASGVDNVPDSWISRWTLLDLFVVLIAALAIARLWNLPSGLFALAALGLMWHEPGAPRYVWLHILAAAALLQVLPAGKFATAVKWYRNLAGLVLLLIAVPFMVMQIRIGLYPQLERLVYPIEPLFSVTTDSAVQQAPMPATAPPPAPQAESEADMAAGGEAALMEKRRLIRPRRGEDDAMGHAMHKDAPPKEPSVNFDLIDPNAKIQTGPGLPQWQWRSVQLSWNGPVDANQQMRFWLLSPALTLLFNLLRVIMLVLLSLLVFGLLNKRFKLNWPPSAAAVLLLPIVLISPKPAHADFPSPKLLEELQQRLLKAPDCAPQCAQISALQVHIDGNMLRLDLQAHSAQNVAIPLPVDNQQWLPQQVTVDDTPAQALYRDEQNQLWLMLPEGAHNVILEGRITAQQEFSLPLPLPPHRVNISAQGWKVEGVHENGVPDGQLLFTRSTPETSAPQTELRPGLLPPFASVERTLLLGLDWRVTTRIVRLSPPDSTLALAVPLLPGESVTSDGVHVKDGKVLVNMPPHQNEMVWESVLKKSAQLDLTAAKTQQWSEIWRADVSPIWHLDSSGLAPVHQPDPHGVWLPEWRPWPGETLHLAISRPNAVPGQTVTVDKSILRASPGKRTQETSLELVLRSSKGGQYSLYLPENADLQSVTIDGMTQPLRLNNRQLVVPTRPGTQTVQVVWRENQGVSPLLRSPAVKLESESVNSHVQVTLGEDRWTLWVHGPRLGPAVLFWGIVAVIALLAYGLGQIRLTPLKPWQWFLLLLGLSQIPLAAALIVIGWLLAMGWRCERPLFGVKTFNAAQIGLGLLSLLSLGLLFYAVQQGLLGSPAMQIGGNDSNAYQLNWYQDRSAAMLPVATVISLPLFGYRLLMLAWSLWLALALLNWLKWGWGCFANGGLWRKGVPKQ